MALVTLGYVTVDVIFSNVTTGNKLTFPSNTQKCGVEKQLKVSVEVDVFYDTPPTLLYLRS